MRELVGPRSLYLGMLLEILGTLEGLAAEPTFMRPQGYMNKDMRDDMVSLYGASTTRAPLASQVEIVTALAANMVLTDMLLRRGLSIP